LNFQKGVLEVGIAASCADVQNDYCAPVLRPARDVITYRDGPFFSIRNCAHPRGFYTMRNEILPHRLGTLCAKRNVVLAGAALISVTFDRKRVTIVLGEPPNLFV
jgi:hypothetical protein